MPIQTPQRSLKSEKHSESCQGARTVRAASTSRPPAFARTAAELRDHIDRLGAERVAAILRLSLEGLEPLLAGRAEPSKKMMRRLRATSG